MFGSGRDNRLGQLRITLIGAPDEVITAAPLNPTGTFSFGGTPLPSRVGSLQEWRTTRNCYSLKQLEYDHPDLFAKVKDSPELARLRADHSVGDGHRQHRRARRAHRRSRTAVVGDARVGRDAGAGEHQPAPVAQQLAHPVDVGGVRCTHPTSVEPSGQCRP